MNTFWSLLGFAILATAVSLVAVAVCSRGP